jgi:hypothetical protein
MTTALASSNSAPTPATATSASDLASPHRPACNRRPSESRARMTAVALALHIFGAVVWVGGMFAIYVCLRPALPTRLTRSPCCAEIITLDLAPLCICIAMVE